MDSGLPSAEPESGVAAEACARYRHHAGSVIGAAGSGVDGDADAEPDARPGAGADRRRGAEVGHPPNDHLKFHYTMLAWPNGGVSMLTTTGGMAPLRDLLGTLACLNDGVTVETSRTCSMLL